MNLKFVRLTILTVMLVTIAGATFAQEKTDEWQWKKEKTLVGFSESYRLYRLGKPEDCHVNVREHGITIVARERRVSLDGGSPFKGVDPATFVTFINQQIDIEQMPDGTVQVTDRRENKSGPDVFTNNYVGAAKDLPPEVQAKFFGKYL